MTKTPDTPTPRSFARRLGLLHIIAIAFTLLPAAAFAQALPAGWTASDVGAPIIPGYGRFSNGTYTVSGSGRGIRNAGDQFTFVHRAIVGDATIVAFVDRVNATRNGEAGVMLRQGLAATAAQAALVVTTSGELTFKRRRATGGNVTSSTANAGSARLWIRLQRRGATVAASWSADGSTWTTIGSDTVAMNNVVRAGMAMSSGSVIAAANANFTGVGVASLVEYGGPLPTGWGTQDVGAPAIPGAAAHDNGTFALVGSGSDIGGSADQFQMASVLADRDIDIVARVRDLGDTDPLSKAGLMIRDSLTPNGAHASMLVTASGTTIFRRRALAGDTTTSTAGPAAAAPTWLKLSLRNGVVTGSQSADGVAWTVVGTQALTLPTPFYAGLVVTSRNGGATVTTNIDGVALTLNEAPNSSPTVALTTPNDGSTHTAPATIAVSANASDSDGTITRVDFFQNGTLIGSDSSSPYSVSWSNVAAGTYSLTAVATDNDNATTTSAARTVTVTAGNQPPSVGLTSPANGATFTAPASIVVSANASDADGSIARVDFYQGATLIGSDTTSPYSVTWNNVPAGSYSVTARAVDNTGGTTTSAAHAVTVSTATVQRRAEFTASPDHDTLVTSYRLEVFAAGANPQTATPLATQNLGKPAVVSGQISVDITSTVNGLSPGNYQATVSAVGSGGSSRSTAAAFTR